MYSSVIQESYWVKVLKGSVMNLTEFGSAVRKARLDARVTLQTMAKDLEVTPAYLSGLEVGRKKISDEWVGKITTYFKSKGIEVEDLAKLADVANKSISLDGMKPQQMMMLAGFARASMSSDQMQRFADLLKEVED